MSFDPLLIAAAGYFVPATLLAIAALALNMQWGQTGLFNAGVAAFVGIGAYVFGMFSTGYIAPTLVSGIPITPGHWGPPVPVDLILSAVIAMAIPAVIGILIAIPTVNLRADYLAIATLAFAEIIRLVFKNESELTGGDQSLNGIPRPFAAFIPAGSPLSDFTFLIIAIVVMVGVLVVLNYLYASPWGRSLKALREDEDAAEAVGKSTFLLKLGATGIGCAVMGLAGALTASFARTVSPQDFLPFYTFTVYVIVILGGSGNNRGVIAGAYLFYLFEWGAVEIQSLPLGIPSSWATPIIYLQTIIIGLLLILFILFRPAGIIPERKYVPPERRNA